MRQVVLSTFVSLDGVMQAPGGPQEDPTNGFRFGGWVAPHFDEAVGNFIDEVFEAPFDLLLGRKTYDIFAAHWPYAPPGDPIGERFNAITKYVATRSKEPLGWKGSVSLGEDVAGAVRRLKGGEGGNLLIQGSSVLVQTLVANDLIDEIHLLVFPIILGSGKRIFGESASPAGLTLTGTKTSGTGVVMASYRRAGEVATGSFEFETPSEAEFARREKMQREG